MGRNQRRFAGGIVKLEDYEADIELAQEKATDARREAGLALIAIHDADLWVDGYISFESYLEKRWNYKKSHGYALMDVGRFCLSLESTLSSSAQAENLPSKYQLRELKKIKRYDETEDDEWRRRVDAWEIVSSDLGPDVESKELNAYLLEKQFITPRATKNWLDEGDRKDKEQAAELKRINKALEVLAEATFDKAYAIKRWGRAQIPMARRASLWFNL